MGLRARIRPRVLGTSILALLIGLTGLTALPPVAVRAGAPGAPPAALQINLNLQAQARGGSFSLMASGVVNHNGDGQFSLVFQVPETHTIDMTVLNNVSYVSFDGGPYQTFDLSQLNQSALPSPSPEAALAGQCLATSLTGDFSQLRSVLGSSVSVTDAGPAYVGDAVTEHWTLHADLQSLISGVAAVVRQAVLSCGASVEEIGATAGINRADIQHAIAGATLDADAYLDADNRLPRLLTADLEVPGVQLSAMLEIDVTPLDAPVPITPPAG